MKKLVTLTLVVVLLLGFTFLGGGVTRASASVSTILAFNVMVGVPHPYTGATNAIRGIPGGGLPWVIQSGIGQLKSNGFYEIQISGLVLDPNDPVVIERGLAGKNPLPDFKVIVSCLSKDASGDATIVNVSSTSFPASPTGDAHSVGMLTLPHPCIAPILFVTSPTGSWFASTGN